jgi:hypothetical protein
MNSRLKRINQEHNTVASMSPVKKKINNSFSKERVNNNIHNKIFTKKNERIEYFKTVKLRNDYKVTQEFSIEFNSILITPILKIKIKELEYHLQETQKVKFFIISAPQRERKNNNRKRSKDNTNGSRTTKSKQ